MLDSAAPDDQRQRVLTGVETTIASGGEIVNTQDWGVRQMAYEIRHKTDTEYHLLQFHGTREVLETPSAHAEDRRRRHALSHHQARAGHPGAPREPPRAAPHGHRRDGRAAEAPAPVAEPADAVA